MANPVYKRILLKLSGEALAGDHKHAIDPEVINRIASEIKEIHQFGVQVAIVVGGGNFCRGATLAQVGIDRVTADQVGMLATLMNALVLQEVIEKHQMPARVHSAIKVGNVVDQFQRAKAIRLLEQGEVVIFAAGTGNPLVTTDSAASLRGIEIQADAILKATNVDGIYDADPLKNSHAQLYRQLTYSEALTKELAVMDLTAFYQCRDHKMVLRVFNIAKQGALKNIILGESEGTVVTI